MPDMNDLYLLPPFPHAIEHAVDSRRNVVRLVKCKLRPPPEFLSRASRTTALASNFTEETHTHETHRLGSADLALAFSLRPGADREPDAPSSAHPQKRAARTVAHHAQHQRLVCRRQYRHRGIDTRSSQLDRRQGQS